MGRALLRSSPMVHGLMGTSMRESERVWQRSSVQYRSCTCEGMQGHPGNGGVQRVETCLVVARGHPWPLRSSSRTRTLPHEKCKIQYRDIGDYLTREQKLEALSEAVSMEGVSDWQTITPNKHHDWIGQRSEAFQQFYPMGSKDARTGRGGRYDISTVFKRISKQVRTPTSIISHATLALRTRGE